MSKDLDKVAKLLNENEQFCKIITNVFVKNNTNQVKFVNSCKLLKRQLDDEKLISVFQLLSSSKTKPNHTGLQKKRVMLDLDLDDDEEEEEQTGGIVPRPSTSFKTKKQSNNNDNDNNTDTPIKFKKLKKEDSIRLKSYNEREGKGVTNTEVKEPSQQINRPDRIKRPFMVEADDLISNDTNSEITLINTPDTNIHERSEKYYNSDQDTDVTDVEDDRAWYGVEEYYNEFDEEELDIRTQEQILRHNKEKKNMNNLRNKKRSQENDLWIRNQMNKSLGRGHDLNPVDQLNGSDEDDEDEVNVRFNIIADHLIPPFLNDSQQGQHQQKQQVMLTNQKTAVEPIKDPEGDLAMMARKGSLLVREKRHENERAKRDQQQHDLSDTKLGKVMGMKGDDDDDKRKENDNDDLEVEEDDDDEAPQMDIHQQRKSLPVFSVKDELVKNIMENQVLIIVGETGSGKTTQIPQYLREAGLTQNGIIGVTQPRRVAAMSVAKRVSEEIGCKLGDEVGYSIRFEDMTSSKTEIKFLTDGILLRECLMDDTLDKYSCIVIDEAHERALNTDILLGLFKSILTKRRDLKLIITSATINADKFSRFFGNAPQFDIPGRTFPVEIFSNAYNVTDYVESCVEQVLKIHSQSQSKGDILCFMTGQEDIEVCCQVLAERVRSFEHMEPLKILPIYSTLPSDLQNKIFNKSKHRKCVVATNIAETSLTVDGIKFVIDCGLSKLKIFNAKLNMDTLQICPISVAQANQRSGRAGRTAPGTCFRLYTLTQQQQEMYSQPIPEIQRTNLSNTLLLLKNLGIKDLVKFPFMDAPPLELITSSLYELWVLKALDNFGNLTELGAMMSKFPLEPSLSKFLIKSIDFGCSSEVISIVAMLTVPQVFIRSKERQQESDAARLKFQIAESDHLTLLNVFNLFLQNTNRGGHGHGAGQNWCNKNFLNHKNLKRAIDIRDQLISIFQQMRIPVKSCGYNNDDIILKCLCSTFYINAAKFAKFGQFTNLKNGLTVLLHPTSALFSMSDFPSYIIYHEILLTSKEYMNYVSVVEPQWLLEFGDNYYTLRNEVEGFDNKRHLKFVAELEQSKAEYAVKKNPSSIATNGQRDNKDKDEQRKMKVKFRSRRGF